MNTQTNNPSPSKTAETLPIEDSEYTHEDACLDSIANSLELLAAVALSVCKAFKIPVDMPTEGDTPE
jgi:hypothetical protein